MRGLQLRGNSVFRILYIQEVTYLRYRRIHVDVDGSLRIHIYMYIHTEDLWGVVGIV